MESLCSFCRIPNPVLFVFSKTWEISRPERVAGAALHVGMATRPDSGGRQLRMVTGRKEEFQNRVRSSPINPVIVGHDE